MRLIWLVWLLVFAHAAAADFGCTPIHQSNRIFFLNSANICAGEALENSTVAAPPPPPPSRPLPPPPPTRPVPRPDNNQLWVKSHSKGCSLTWAMHAPDVAVGPAYSPARNTAKALYQSTSDLAKWFWTHYPHERTDPAFYDFYSTWGIGWALADLGVDPYSTEYEGGKNAVFVLDHEDFRPGAKSVDEQWYTVDGKWYRATGASYAFSINAEQGVVMGLNRKSPRYAALERSPRVAEEMLPGLSQFSDVAWIGWETIAKQMNTKINNLRYFLSVGIDNKDTKEIIERAMYEKNWDLSEWPGHIFDESDAQTSALLGTPNLQGFAYFLIQHKEQLGNMYISRIQVFHGETEHKNPCVVMHVSQPGTTAVKTSTRAMRKDQGVNVVRTHTLRL